MLHFMININTVNKSSNSIHLYLSMRFFLQIQSVSDCFLQGRLLKMDTTWIPYAKIPALMPESLWHWSLCLTWTCCSEHFHEGAGISKSHGESPTLYGGWSNNLQLMQCSDFDRVSHVGMGVVQHRDTSDKHANISYFDGRSLRVPQRHSVLLVMSDSFHAHVPKSNILGSYSIVRAAVGPVVGSLQRGPIICCVKGMPSCLNQNSLKMWGGRLPQQCGRGFRCSGL